MIHHSIGLNVNNVYSIFHKVTIRRFIHHIMIGVTWWFIPLVQKMKFPSGISRVDPPQLPSGNLLHSYGNSPFLIGESTINGNFP